jgi:hypothetical protein
LSQSRRCGKFRERITLETRTTLQDHEANQGDE